MTFTILKEYWEEGSRPGRMKLNTTWNTDVIEARILEEAIEIMQKRFAHACQISYGQVQFHSIHLFEGDVEGEPNPFYGRKRWTLENEEVVREHARRTLGSERPGYWAKLLPDQQRVVAVIDKVSSTAANRVARQFQTFNLPS